MTIGGQEGSTPNPFTYFTYLGSGQGANSPQCMSNAKIGLPKRGKALQRPVVVKLPGKKIAR